MFFGNLFVYIQFQGKEEITHDMRTIVFWVLVAVSIVGLLFLLILRPAVNTTNEDIVVTKPLDALKNAAQLFVTRDMILLCWTFFYTGM